LDFVGRGTIDEPGQVQTRQSGDDVVIRISLPGFGATEMVITLQDTRLSQITEADFIL
jgi:HSP20 family molecular chaperone IbpA